MSNVTGCTAHDPARRAIRVGGAESADFLQSILTSDVEALAAGEIRASALLTPQGRILADMMVLRVEDGFLLDCDTTRADDLFTRLRRYRLRRPITLEQLDDHQLWVGWDGAPAPEGAGTDPRHPALGWRWIGTAGTGPETASGTRPAQIEEWHALRIAAGVPQGPVDLQPERALMLEAGLDRLGAVDFEKGCYVGQDVTARTGEAPHRPFDSCRRQPGERRCRDRGRARPWRRAQCRGHRRRGDLPCGDETVGHSPDRRWRP